jgi:hypothetical protein
MYREIDSEVDKGLYILRHERWRNSEEEDWMPIDACYSKIDGGYIGNEDIAKNLCEKRGIDPQINESDHTVCSIGYCFREDRWYGWSHRAIAGFGIGDEVHSSEHVCAESLPVGFTVRTSGDARKMASAFAKSVS